METKIKNEKSTTIGINPNTLFLKTLRSSGYNNQMAIADIVDNSLDNEVNANIINIITKNLASEEKGFISISDNGCGMNFETLQEALKLGSQTGKDASIDLGCYGTGLKSAALSLGRKFTVQTKAIDDVFYIAEFDIDEIEKSKKWEIPCRVGSEEEFEEFKKTTNNEIGTIITISKLDKVTNTSLTSFNDILKKNFAYTYNIFISERNVDILINGDKIPAVDPMWRHLESTQRLSELNDKILYNGKEYVYNVFHIAKVDTGDRNKKDDDINKINRCSAAAGIYIYRNSRLVGSGLGLGIINKYGDSHLAGLRIELFVDGTDDAIFGSTFLKIIQEKNKSDIDQGFRDKLESTLKPYWVTSKALNQKDDKLTENEDMVNKVKKIEDTINTNPHIPPSIHGGRNRKKENIDIGPKPESKTKHKFNHRIRQYGFCILSLESLGTEGAFVRFLKIDGNHVEINVDHIFYQEFLSQCDENTLGIILRLLVSFNLAKTQTTWHDPIEKDALLDEFFINTSNLLRKIIKY